MFRDLLFLLDADRQRQIFETIWVLDPFEVPLMVTLILKTSFFREEAKYPVVCATAASCH